MYTYLALTIALSSQQDVPAVVPTGVILNPNLYAVSNFNGYVTSTSILSQWSY